MDPEKYRKQFNMIVVPKVTDEAEKGKDYCGRLLYSQDLTGKKVVDDYDVLFETINSVVNK